MKIRIALASATALGLMMGGASADGNEAYLDQTGTANSASVTQSATSGGNHAGANSVGLRMLQSGERNTLQITQQGGAKAGHALDGINQTGNWNLLAITQDGGEVRQVQQDTSGASSPPQQPFTSNMAIVTQSGGANAVDQINQNYTGPGGFTPSTRNLAVVSQIGGSTAGTVSQTGHSNDAWISQDGAGNNVSLLRQNGVGNYANLTQNGTNNGAGLLTGAAGASGAASGTVDQIGSGNSVIYSVLSGGSGNEFGFFQDGIGNAANGIVITGHGNHLGVHQDGTNNSLTLAAISGDDNVMGLVQDGVDNTASVTINDNRNMGYNAFGANVAGALATANGLTSGLLEQSGTFNQVTLTVSGNDNVFASLQDNSAGVGTWNKITGSQSGGGNQAAVVQVGNQNTTSFSQSGNGNFAAISQ